MTLLTNICRLESFKFSFKKQNTSDNCGNYCIKKLITYLNILTDIY